MGEILNGTCWDHHWFGFWRDEGLQFAECPSLREWVNESWWSDKDVQDVASYLSSAPVVVAGGLERCLICGQVGSRGVAFRTDGDWYWSDTLAHYVLAHGIRLPGALYSRIQAANYSPPELLWTTRDEYRRVLSRLDVPIAHKELIAGVRDDVLQ